MNLTDQLAKNLRDVHFGESWTAVNMKQQLIDLTWRQATRQLHSFHPIATLVFHTNYFVRATSQVLDGGPLDAHDKFSFDVPPIACDEEWDSLQQQVWDDAEKFATLIEQMPESQLWETFVDEKYGTYYRCIQGVIEHTHYHVGQIALMKKLVLTD